MEEALLKQLDDFRENPPEISGIHSESASPKSAVSEPSKPLGGWGTNDLGPTVFEAYLPIHGLLQQTLWFVDYAECPLR